MSNLKARLQRLAAINEQMENELGEWLQHNMTMTDSYFKYYPEERQTHDYPGAPANVEFYGTWEVEISKVLQQFPELDEQSLTELWNSLNNNGFDSHSAGIADLPGELYYDLEKKEAPEKKMSTHEDQDMDFDPDYFGGGHYDFSVEGGKLVMKWSIDQV